jgi:hypothetical protein
MNPSILDPSDYKSNRPVIDGSSLIDCLFCPMRGLSGWFNQVSTDDIKKKGLTSNCLADFSVPQLPDL